VAVRGIEDQSVDLRLSGDVGRLCHHLIFSGALWREDITKSAKREAADGSTVDAEGYLWNALVYDGRIVHHNPDGRVDRIIEMPVKKVTSVMFGGLATSSLDQTYFKGRILKPSTD
jgi:hypothetical protein